MPGLRSAILFVAAVLVLAGCSDATPDAEMGATVGPSLDATDTTTTSAPVKPLEVKTSAERGGIKGVVVDAAIRPLADAVVTLVSEGRNVTTTSDGQFGFDLLEPGTYFVEARAPRFLVSQNSVQVEAGKTQSIRIQLEGDGTPTPRHITEKFTGHADFDAGPAPDSAPLQCGDCSWTIHPEPGFATFVVEATGTTSTPRPDPPAYQSLFAQVTWTFLDKDQTHGTGYNSTTLPFTSHVAGSLFLNSTPEITVTVSGGATYPNGQMDFDVFVTTFYVDVAPPGWTFLDGDE